jgi:phytoene dehydrogenase-like protein
MLLNFKLFKNFKEAARKCDLEVKPGSGYYTIKLPNGRYIYCWTPLNKMFSLYNYYEDKEWDRALKYMEDNFDDFHLEFGGDSIKEMNLVCEAFCDVNDKNLSVQEIVDFIETLKDDDKLEKRLVWKRIKYGAEE